MSQEINISNDGSFDIAIGRSRKETTRACALSESLVAKLVELEIAA